MSEAVMRITDAEGITYWMEWHDLAQARDSFGYDIVVEKFDAHPVVLPQDLRHA